MNQNKENNNYYNHIVSDALNRWKNEEPVRRGCSNAGSPCFCSGACNEIVGWKPRTNELPIFNPPVDTKEEESHFEDIEEPETCNHPEHKPPMHLHIPQGKRYVHICPGCKQRSVLQPPQIKF